MNTNKTTRILGSFAICVAIVLGALMASQLNAQDGVAAPTKVPSIAQIMQRAHKKPKTGGSMLLKKVALGSANATEKQELLKLYKSMSTQKPPKGDAASWQAKTKLLVDAADAALKGMPGADKKLNRAANCSACHNDHKGGT